MVKTSFTTKKPRNKDVMKAREPEYGDRPAFAKASARQARCLSYGFGCALVWAKVLRIKREKWPESVFVRLRRDRSK
jgi:hypothetical protein